MIDEADPTVTDAMDPQARRFLAMVALGASGAAVGIAERRASFAKLMRWSRPPAAPVATLEKAVAGCGGAIALRIYSPENAPAASPGLIYFHGGGLVAGSLDTHDRLCRTLAAESGCRILAVGYRLAPEHPFPAAILDAIAATRAVLRDPARFGLNGDAIAVGGDSGGATLATVVAGLLRGRGRLRAQVLLCPVLDITARSASRRLFDSGFLLDAATMASDLGHYAPGRSLDDRFVSPLFRPDCAGMAPAIIHTAGFDPLRDEGAAYAERLRHAGVPLRYTCHATLVHHFYGLTGVIAAARPALSQIAGEIRAALA